MRLRVLKKVRDFKTLYIIHKFYNIRLFATYDRFLNLINFLILMEFIGLLVILYY